MKLKVLGSSSKGNCYLIQNKNETLIIECGLAYRNIVKALDFNLSNVVGCLITHEHKDHSKSIKDLIKNGIDIYSSRGTFEALEINSHRAKAVKSEEQFKVGNFTVVAFQTQHDCIEPLGFLIFHEELGKLLFATDTYYIQYNFPGLNHILIECNYDEDILSTNVESKKVHPSLKKRIVRSHFSLTNLKGFFKANDLSKVLNIILIHLSSDNSDSEYFRKEIEKVTGKPVGVASNILEMELIRYDR